MAKLTADVSASFDTGDKPANVSIADDPAAPESIRGKTVAGRAKWHGYQGVILDEGSRVLWRGPTHEAPNMFGYVTVAGVRYNGNVVPGEKTDAAARAAALADALAQLPKMASPTSRSSPWSYGVKSRVNPEIIGRVDYNQPSSTTMPCKVKVVAASEARWIGKELTGTVKTNICRAVITYKAEEISVGPDRVGMNMYADTINVPDELKSDPRATVGPAYGGTSSTDAARAAEADAAKLLKEAEAKYPVSRKGVVLV